MIPTAISLCEQIGDQAAELGLRLAKLANPRRLFPAEAAVHLREAQRAIRRAAEALERCCRSDAS